MDIAVIIKCAKMVLWMWTQLQPGMPWINLWFSLEVCAGFLLKHHCRCVDEEKFALFALFVLN